MAALNLFRFPLIKRGVRYGPGWGCVHINLGQLVVLAGLQIGSGAETIRHHLLEPDRDGGGALDAQLSFLQRGSQHAGGDRRQAKAAG